jgi:magnesium chelatase accessory protein
MILDGHVPDAAFISLNGALATPPGLPALLFSPVAKLLAASSLVPKFFAWSVGDRAAVERLVTGTGSKLDASGIEFYGRLVRNPAHVAGVLEMMSQWELAPLERDLARLRTPTLLVVAGNDRTVPPSEGQRLAAMIPGSRLLTLPGLGHLAHEEQPGKVADLIREMAPRTTAAA